MHPKLFSRRFVNAILITLAVILLSFSWGSRLIGMQKSEKALDQRMWQIMYSLSDRMDTVDNLQQVIEMYADRDLRTILNIMVSDYDRTGTLPTTLSLYKNRYPNLELYVIDEKNQIIMTTKPADLGLSFGTTGTFVDQLEAYRKNQKYYSPRVAQSTTGGELIKYSYYPTKDKKYIFEASDDLKGFGGFMMKNSFMSLSSSFSNQEPEIIDLTTYSGSGYNFENKSDLKEAADPQRLSHFNTAIKERRIIQYDTFKDGIRTSYLYLPYYYLYQDVSFSVVGLELVYSNKLLKEAARWPILRDIAFTLLFILSLLLINRYFSIKFLRPLIEVFSTISKISEGDFKTEAKVHVNNEIGVLASSLNDMIRHIDTLVEEKNQIHQVQIDQLSRLVSGLAHELNTPIGNGITSVSYMTRMISQLVDGFNSGALSKSQLQQALMELQDSSDLTLKNLMRGADLIDRFKTLAVAQNSESIQLLDLHELIDYCIATVHPADLSQGYDIHNGCPSGLMIHTYPNFIHQLLANLILNSFHHGFRNDGHDRIDIEVSIEDQLLTLSYRDNGLGMDPDTISKLYEPFYSKNRSGKYTGLGMNIVYNIVTQKLMGQITCKSIENEGTLFIIQFPILIDERGLDAHQ